MLYFDGMMTPIGRLHIVVSDNALLHIYFPSDTWTEEYIRRPLHPLLVRVKKELKEYFAGKRKKFTVPACLNCGDELGVPGDAVVRMLFRPRRNYQMDIRLVKSIDEFL